MIDKFIIKCIFVVFGGDIGLLMLNKLKVLNVFDLDMVKVLFE